MYIYKFRVKGYPVILPEEGFTVLEDFARWRIRTWSEYIEKIRDYILPYYVREMGRVEDVASELYRLYMEREYEIERIITVYRTSVIAGYHTNKPRPTDIEYRAWIYHEEPDKYSEADCDDMISELKDVIKMMVELVMDIGYEISHAIERVEIAPPDADMDKWYGYVSFYRRRSGKLSWWLLERHPPWDIVANGVDYVPPTPREVQRWKWW
jgi:hypothetical protein